MRDACVKPYIKQKETVKFLIKAKIHASKEVNCVYSVYCNLHQEMRIFCMEIAIVKQDKQISACILPS